MVNKDLQEFGQDPPPQGTGMLAFDAEKYLEHVEDLQMTDAQKTEFLRVLWDIMASFVHLGFSSDSVIPLLAQKASERNVNALQEVIPTHTFNVAADDEAEKVE